MRLEQCFQVLNPASLYLPKPTAEFLHWSSDTFGVQVQGITNLFLAASCLQFELTLLLRDIAEVSGSSREIDNRVWRLGSPSFRVQIACVCFGNACLN